MEATLIKLNRFQWHRGFSLKLEWMAFCVGRRKLGIAVSDLLFWLMNYGKEGRFSAFEISEKKGNFSIYIYLFDKFPTLFDYLNCSEMRIDFKESINMTRRKELARFVEDLPSVRPFITRDFSKRN